MRQTDCFRAGKRGKRINHKCHKFRTFDVVVAPPAAAHVVVDDDEAEKLKLNYHGDGRWMQQKQKPEWSEGKVLNEIMSSFQCCSDVVFSWIIAVLVGASSTKAFSYFCNGLATRIPSYPALERGRLGVFFPHHQLEIYCVFSAHIRWAMERHGIKVADWFCSSAH